MLALMSCEKKDKEAGLEIQPDENRLKVAHINLDQFITKTSKSGPVKTSKANSSILLGSIDDDIFGRTTASFVSQYRLSSDNVDFGTNPQIISTIAYLDISGVDGDADQEVHYQIFESNFIIDPDSSYYSDMDLSESVGDVVADTTFSFDAVFSEESSNIMEIPLFDTFGQNILDTDSVNLVDNDKFLEVFKGLYFTVDTNQVGDGLMWKYNFSSSLSYITLKYTSTDENGNLILDEDSAVVINTFNLQFNEHSGRFNQYINNTAPLDGVFEQEYNEVYVAGMAGPRGHIDLSPVLAWRDSTKLMIYKAELLVKAQPSGDFPMPTRLLMEIDDSDDEVIFVNDYLPNAADNYDGTYDEETETYSMIITRHVQNLINENHNDSLLWIYPYSQITNPYRVILLNGKEDENFTLKITYSKLY